MIQSTDLTIIEFKFVSATSNLLFTLFTHKIFFLLVSKTAIKPSFVLQPQLLKQESI